MRQYPLFGGLRLPGRKQAAERPIQPCPLPERLWVALEQHAGPPGRVCVEPGQHIAAGAPLSIAEDARELPVHAPCAAEVIAIEPRPLAHAEGLHALHIELRPLAEHGVDTLAPLDPEHTDAETLRQRLRDAGLAGLGGAGFPTFDKLGVPRRLLILNGAECEPYIACDDRLLRERPEQVVAAARVLRRIAGAERCLIAIEDCMTEAGAALRAALGQDEATLALATVPTVYPQGGERQLIQRLTGLEVPLGGLPRDIGVLVLNVGTAVAAWQAIVHGRPLTHRLVSVAGAGVAAPGVFEVAIGTPIADLITAAGGYTEQAVRLILGGPLMGRALPDDSFPIGKTCNAVLVLGADELPVEDHTLPCIRCGECAIVCPARLLPQQLFAFAEAQHWQRLSEHGLQACIECGCCDLVCPSHLPLAQQFRYAKTALRQREVDSERSLQARQRHLARDSRLQREAAEREARMAEKRRKLSTPTAVQQAVERGRHDERHEPKA